MTVEEVIARVEEIRKIRGDDEMAHVYEDRLFSDVLHFIAEDSRRDGFRTEYVDLAREALKTQEIHFARWYA